MLCKFPHKSQAHLLRGLFIGTFQVVLLSLKESFYYMSERVIACEWEHNRCLYIDLLLGSRREVLFI